MLVSRRTRLADGDAAAWCDRVTRDSESYLERFGPVFEQVSRYPAGIVADVADVRAGVVP
jgi:hypothetical protein